MHDFNINTGSDLPDLHNRRDNIAAVAADCKANNYPLIAWPEDKELLRLDDLPRFVCANCRPTWVTVMMMKFHLVTSDNELRRIIKPGLAYAINPSLQQLASGYMVETYSVVTR